MPESNSSESDSAEPASPEAGSRRGRPHNADGAREAILDAAEAVFAEHGFDGARVDAIASRAGYNKSLIFQYFGDKLNLYAEVLRRADRRMCGFQERILQELSDAGAAISAEKVESIFREGIQVYLDFILENPNIMRMYNWELAEGWQTYSKIVSQPELDDVEKINSVLGKIQSAGLLRTTVSPVIQLTISVYICQFFIAMVPLFQAIQKDQDLYSPEAIARGREFITEFVIHGIMEPVSSRVT